MSRAHLKEEEKDLHQHQWPLENLPGTRNDHLFCFLYRNIYLSKYEWYIYKCSAIQ